MYHICSPLPVQASSTCCLNKRERSRIGVKNINVCSDTESLSLYDPTYTQSILRHNSLSETMYVQSAKSGREVFHQIQTEITADMHVKLVDWLLKVLSTTVDSATLYLSVHILDDCLQRASIPVREFQLVGCTCVLLAAKLEQKQVPSISDFVKIADRCFTHASMIAMERRILSCIEFEIIRPTRLFFLSHLLLISRIDAGDSRPYEQPRGRFLREQSLAHMLLDITLLYTRPHGESIWSTTMEFYTQYSEKELYPIVQRIAADHYALYSSGFTGVLKKYDKPEYFHCSSSVVAVTPQQLKFDKLVSPVKLFHYDICQKIHSDVQQNIVTCTLDPSHLIVSNGFKQCVRIVPEVVSNIPKADNTCTAQSCYLHSSKRIRGNQNEGPIR